MIKWLKNLFKKKQYKFEYEDKGRHLYFDIKTSNYIKISQEDPLDLDHPNHQYFIYLGREK